jgi:hypothetical protein
MRHFGLFLLSLTQGLDNYLTQGVDNKQEVFSVDDEGIPSANRELKYQDGDIRREFEDAPGNIMKYIFILYTTILQNIFFSQ